MMKRLIRHLILGFLILAMSACSEDSEEPRDPCTTLNPPPSCEAPNNENNLNNTNNDNNVNNLSCDPECSGETPVCSDGACVECGVGTDCESGVCDETTNTCTGCVDNDECTGATPRCDAGMCVACDTASDEGCGDETPFCETVDGDAVCVACDAPGTTANCPAGTTCTDAFVCSSCESNDECTETDASACESPGTETASCVACQQASDCSHIEGTNQCHEGECVECTAGTEAMDCSGNVCVPNSLRCSGETRRSVSPPYPCISDTSCVVGSYCVPVDYQGSFQGTYCLPRVRPFFERPRCTKPFGRLSERTTTSGRTVEVCVFNERLVAPETIMVFGQDCTVENGPLPGECEVDGVAAPGARCEVVGEEEQCTYTCAGNTDCKLDVNCGGGVSNGYCGGP